MSVEFYGRGCRCGSREAILPFYRPSGLGFKQNPRRPSRFALPRRGGRSITGRTLAPAPPLRLDWRHRVNGAIVHGAIVILSAAKELV